MKKISLFLLLIGQILTASVYANTWQQDVKAWRLARVESLTKPNGWLSLIDMQWLKKGENTLGSAADNAIVLPHGPAQVGSFWWLEDKIQFTPITGVPITVNDSLVNARTDVNTDATDNPSMFSVDSFLFYVIERDKPALRIKDSQAQSLKEFSGIDYFPLSEDFFVDAEFIPYEPAKTVEIVNVLGLLSQEKSLGQLKFSIKGETYSLDALDGGDELYVIFADKTSGRSSYGPGRFLYVPKPDANNRTRINFHKAYNPPCAFTDYSTCPLPPPQNRLPVYIEAGEKKYRR